MMKNTDKRVDEYIANSQPFAQPILHYIRTLVHEAIPAVSETIKWGFPHFEYHGIVCSMAAFKAHCALLFNKASLMSDPEKILQLTENKAMGHFNRIVGLDNLPDKSILISYLQEAAYLNHAGIKKMKKAPSRIIPIETPNWILDSFNKNEEVRSTFDALSNSHKKEYIEWIMGAKTEETRTKRLQKTIDYLSEGKSLNWKYQKK